MHSCRVLLCCIERMLDLSTYKREAFMWLSLADCGWFKRSWDRTYTLVLRISMVLRKRHN